MVAAHRLGGGVDFCWTQGQKAGYSGARLHRRCSIAEVRLAAVARINTAHWNVIEPGIEDRVQVDNAVRSDEWIHGERLLDQVRDRA